MAEAQISVSDTMEACSVRVNLACLSLHNDFLYITSGINHSNSSKPVHFSPTYHYGSALSRAEEQRLCNWT